MTPASRYLNREASWVSFNARVLSEAESADHPILERIKFAAIFESNLDEFYMVRVSGLIEQDQAKIRELSPDGLTAGEQLEQIAALVKPLRERANQVVKQKLLPALSRAGVKLILWESLSESERKRLTDVFERDIFPILTPLMVSPATTFPFISNRSLNLAVELEEGEEEKLARVKIPPVVPRCIPVPGRKNSFILVENLIAAHVGRLFPNVRIKATHLFRVIRDADVEIRELEAGDLISIVEQTLRLRRLGDPVLLEHQATLPPHWRQILMEGLVLDESDVLTVDGPIGLDFFWELSGVDIPRHKRPPIKPYTAPALRTPESLFETVAESPVLLHHPYDSFGPVEAFVSSGNTDPAVIGVKQTLYRVGQKSPIVESLLQAAEQGKQIAVMVELKARFDESNNLVWARALERAGVHVSYGFARLKTHCKLSLVVRKEEGGFRTYAHIGTGNYNPATARLYTDLGLLTSDPEICQDVSDIFNYLTGFSRQAGFKKLLVAPLNVRESIIDLIGREAEIARAGGAGRILFKLNALVDPEVIDALYDASQAGVKIDLVVRGICCLRPGVKGLSENIKVRSIVGRFLEHSRVYWFGGGGTPRAYMGSADMMRRNLDRRIEVLAPVEEPSHLRYIEEEVFGSALRDNKKAWSLNSAGGYRKVRPGRGEEGFNSQERLLRNPAGRLLEGWVSPSSFAHSRG